MFGVDDRLNVYKEPTAFMKTSSATTSTIALPIAAEYVALRCYWKLNDRVVAGEVYYDDRMMVVECTASCTDRKYFVLEYY